MDKLHHCRLGQSISASIGAMRMFSTSDGSVVLRMGAGLSPGDKWIARSQAKALTHGIGGSGEVIIDFDGVPEIGQAFADELFRVFAAAHPHLRLKPRNMTTAVSQMVSRALAGATSVASDNSR